ncbi:MAG: iron-sulfur cluster repair di-iron protein [Candidatus ainarchaeum sp.]|nr:iron-sulfur cluster repair di-iron protein [Candidatus ainarchaeum sp.]
MIKEKNIINGNELVSEIVAKDYNTAEIFKDYGIDFCCGGRISINEICEQNGIRKENLLKKLNELPKNKFNENVIENLDLDTLTVYIVNTHHAYVRDNSLKLISFLSKLKQVHGENHPELKIINDIFNEINSDLIKHMQDEETILFPHIRKIVHNKIENTALKSPYFKNLGEYIKSVEAEHTIVGDKVKEIRKITNNFILPKDACNTYQITFAILIEFENDLYRHIHLENNILFPKAIKLENKIN